MGTRSAPPKLASPTPGSVVGRRRSSPSWSASFVFSSSMTGVAGNVCLRDQNIQGGPKSGATDS